jgi:prephenate dehydrogenase
MDDPRGEAAHPPHTTPEPKTVTLYGVGLINGSLGLALRARGFGGAIVGAGRRVKTLRAALEAGAVDRYTDPPSAAAEADIVVVGTPVDITARVVADLSAHAREDAIFTDVGSVKTSVVAACAAGADGVRFVGAHPIAGSEQSGVGSARADLFEGATCIVTSGPQADPAAVEAIRWLWESVGAKVVVTTPETHDALLAASSHLPHVVATALAHLVSSSGADGLNAAAYGGGGLRDATRVALGSADVWTPILMANAADVAAVVDRMSEDLARLADALRAGDADVLRGWLERGRELRADMPHGK